jgi:hypothetical protein
MTEGDWKHLNTLYTYNYNQETARYYDEPISTLALKTIKSTKSQSATFHQQDSEERNERSSHE